MPHYQHPLAAFLAGLIEGLAAGARLLRLAARLAFMLVFHFPVDVWRKYKEFRRIEIELESWNAKMRIDPLPLKTDPLPRIRPTPSHTTYPHPS